MYIENPARGIRINLLVPVGLVFLLLLNGFKTGIAILLAATVHEIGHVAAAFLCSADIDRFDIELWGGRMYYSGMQGYGKELAISLGGICFNLAFAPLGLLPLLGIYGKLYFWACIAYALVNLIPAKTLDGGEVLRCILSLRCDEYTAYSIQTTVNGIAVLAICGLGIVLCTLSGFNSSVLMLSVITTVLVLER